MREYLPERNRYVTTLGCVAFDIAVKSGAEVLSYFTDGNRKTVGSYSYENANGQRFLVFAFDGYDMTEHAFKQYSRGAEIEEWISAIGKTLLASMLGNPDCYMLCLENDGGKAVWIGNFFADECMNTTVTLDREYRNIDFINCSGTLSGNKVTIESIAPYASLGFVVK